MTDPKKRNQLFLLFLLFLSSLSCKDISQNEKEKKIKEFQNVQLPVYFSAIDSHEKFYKKHLVKRVDYNVDMYYPAEAIVKFYDREMDKVSFKPFVEDYYRGRDRQWCTYVDGTKKGEPYVAVWKAGWLNHAKSKRATLVLKYFWYENKNAKIIMNKNKSLSVEFRIQPFFVEPPQEDPGES